MSVYTVSGDATTVSVEMTALVDRLVGDQDRSLILEDFDCAETGMEIPHVADALATPPMFSPRRVVLVRNFDSLDAARAEALAAAIDSRVDEVDVVLTSKGKPPKALADALKRAGAEAVGRAAPSRPQDRMEMVEARFIEAGFTYSVDAVRLVSTWFGGDTARVAGLVTTLLSAYGEGANLSRSDVEVFLGEAGSVAPWDLTDAIDRGDVDASLRMLHRMMGAGGSHPLQVLALLANRYAQMMRLDGRGARSVDDAVAVLGGKEFTARKVLEQYQRLGSAGVARAVSLLAGADVDLRGGKDWEPEMVMEILIARLAALGGANRGAGSRGGPRRGKTEGKPATSPR